MPLELLNSAKSFFLRFMTGTGQSRLLAGSSELSNPPPGFARYRGFSRVEGASVKDAGRASLPSTGTAHPTRNQTRQGAFPHARVWRGQNALGGEAYGDRTEYRGHRAVAE